MCTIELFSICRLTVEEHIYFYGRLKGRSRAEVDAEMEQMIRDVGLPHKRRDLAKNLSGGRLTKTAALYDFVFGNMKSESDFWRLSFDVNNVPVNNKIFEDNRPNVLHLWFESVFHKLGHWIG